MTFNITKMERPHRSGVIAVCIMYALMYAALDFTSLGCHGGDATWVDVTVCHLFPPLCFCLPKHLHPPVVARQYNVTKLIYCPDCRVKKPKDEDKDCRHTITTFPGQSDAAFITISCTTWSSAWIYFKSHESSWLKEYRVIDFNFNTPEETAMFYMAD